ncbi:hypothetical protein [Nocardioides sp.]|uniref:hypothetical protein n=1 Tax=Nocardioides sp. TaxID=35761 RepID=UPI002719C52B|nr:hypothetical protein [Nocardioides sp.]MDO9456987.1 hypothetical protein [Nocardioides sp.]
MTTYDTLLLLAASALLVPALAACDDGSTARDADRGEPPTAFADLPPDQIARTAKDAVRGSGALFLERDLTVDGVSTSIDLHLDDEGNCLGSIRKDDGTASILGVEGTIWFRPDEAFWRLSDPDVADAVVDEVRGRWVETQSLGDLCDLDLVFGDADSTGERHYETLGTDEVDGEQVVRVRSTGDDGISSVASVLTAEPHYLVQVDAEGRAEGTVWLSGFGEDVATQPPPARDRVDQDELDALPD